jgi:amino acid transporter
MTEHFPSITLLAKEYNMKSIYDDILERDFRTDSEGRTVFFAKGLRKPGYMIPNEEKKDEIKKIISRYSSLLLSILLVGFFLLSISLIGFIIGTLLFLLLHFWNRRLIDRAIAGLSVSDLNPPFDKVNFGVGTVLLVVIFIFMLSGFLFLGMAKSGGINGILIAAFILLFIIIAAVIGIYFIAMKKKQENNS